MVMKPGGQRGEGGQRGVRRWPGEGSGGERPTPRGGPATGGGRGRAHAGVQRAKRNIPSSTRSRWPVQGISPRPRAP
eukprot:780374-Pyramimonas_sp.AAC.1